MLPFTWKYLPGIQKILFHVHVHNVLHTFLQIIGRFFYGSDQQIH